MPFLFLFPPLGVFLLGLLALAIGMANYYYGTGHTSGIVGFLQKITRLSFVGQLFTAATHLFTKALTSFMGKAFQATDAPVGAAFHYIATTVRKLTGTITAFSAFAITVAQAVSGQVDWAQVSKALRGLRVQIKAEAHTARVALQRTIAQEKAAVRSVAQGVYPRLRAIEHEIARPIQHEIKSARELAREAERSAAHAWRWIHAHRYLPHARTWEDAVAIGLSALGLQWLRCSNNPFNKNPNACGLWSDLESLLGLLALGLAIDNLETLVREAQALEEGVAVGIADLFGV